MEEKKKISQEDLLEAKKEMTQDDLLAADAYFNLASMLGKSIQAAVYQIEHPEYDPEVLSWAGTIEDEEVTAEDEAASEAPAQEPVQKNGPVIHSNEGSIDTQIDQLIALYDPRLRELIGTASLYEMFHVASEQFHFQMETSNPDQELSAIDKRKMAIAWVIVKRVFAVRHPDETLRVLSITDSIRGNIFHGQKPPAFRPMDKTDEEMIIETCGLFSDGFGSDSSMIQALDRISQIPPQDERYIPLLSKPFREQRAIAARNKLAPVNVGDAVIKARIGKDGEPPVELSEFEMLIQQVIGEMIQYFIRLNGESGLPIRITPEQIYRWAYYDGSNLSSPSAEIRSKIVTAVDKLIQTPAELHILEQLEKHTKLKSKPGYKKLMKNEGKIIGTLITGRHYSASYNGKELRDTFVIYDMPMFFYYSSFTGQLLKTDSKLITGETVKTGQTRKTYNDIILREHILYRVNLIKKNKQEKNKNIRSAAKRAGERPKVISNYTKTILLSTLAEESDIVLDTPKKLEVFRNKVIDYLQELADQGEIKSAEPKYESRRITGVSVTV